MIRIELPTAEVQTGETLAGQVHWNSESQKKPRRLVVLCRWRVEGKVKKYQQHLDPVEQLDMDSRSQAVIPFAFDIPTEGPLSYEGKLFRVIWEIEARADLPMARDEVDLKTITVKPRPWDEAEWELEDEDDEFDATDIETDEDLEDEES